MPATVGDLEVGGADVSLTARGVDGEPLAVYKDLGPHVEGHDRFRIFGVDESDGGS